MIRAGGGVPAALLVVIALTGCSAAAVTGTSTGPYPVNPGSITCAELQANGGELVAPTATELADSVPRGGARPAAAATLQVDLVSACRGQRGSFRPASDAVTYYREQHP